jgi:hypothetical protein
MFEISFALTLSSNSRDKTASVESSEFGSTPYFTNASVLIGSTTIALIFPFSYNSM